jgi:hypothetical protein
MLLNLDFSINSGIHLGKQVLRHDDIVLGHESEGLLIVGVGTEVGTEGKLGEVGEVSEGVLGLGVVAVRATDLEQAGV